MLKMEKTRAHGTVNLRSADGSIAKHSIRLSAISELLCKEYKALSGSELSDVHIPNTFSVQAGGFSSSDYLSTSRIHQKLQMSMFDHSKSVVAHGGTFIGPTQTSSEAFKILQSKVAPGAFHNSGERFDPPKCHPHTRQAVIERIMNWIAGKESMNSLIMWLNGAAGAGKSAIAQTIAELCYAAGILLASFFFSRSDPHRNNITFLVPTLAYQICTAIPEARVRLERVIDRDPLIFTRSLEAQMIALIVEPLQPLISSGHFTDPATSMRLIILDGLDEIMEHRAQAKLLEVISNILVHHHVPLIILVASRPEQQILFSFDSAPISPLTSRLRLDDKFQPDNDIRLFLDDSFSAIKSTHPRKNLIPESWPTPEVVHTLIRKASGQFIYASTVTKFVASIRHKPTDRLEIILGLRPVHRDLPFSELDALYIHILSTLEDPHRTLLVIAILLVMSPYYDNSYNRTTSGVEHLLGLDVGDAELLLADMASLVSLEGDEIKTIRMLHASFGDFLFDSSRSGAFAIDRKTMHTRMTCLYLQHINERMYDPMEDDWGNQYGYMIVNLRYHLIHSKPSAELIGHLSQLSWDILLDDIRLHIRQFPSEDNIDLAVAWFAPGHFTSAIDLYDLEESIHRDLQTRLYDSILIRELDILQDGGVQKWFSVTFLLCLGIITAELRHGWDLEGQFQLLIGYNSRLRLPTQPGLLSQYNLVFRLLMYNLDALHQFLHDAFRAEKYYLSEKKYADASLNCLNYITSHRLALPINLYHTRRIISTRRTSPFKTQRLLKFLEGRRIWQKIHSHPRAYYVNHQIQMCFPKLGKRFNRHNLYSFATELGLKFLPKALQLSAKSDALVAFARAEKPFSQRAVQYPALVKKCRAALAAYLARVEGADDELNQHR